jgi:hypothetical protein
MSGTRLVEGGHLVCPEPGYVLPPLLEDIEFRRCTVERCQNPRKPSGPDDRSVVRNLTLLRCHVTASELPPVVAEDCIVDTVWLHRGIWGPQVLRGWAFRHVVIRGNITGSLALTPGPSWPGLRATSDATSDPYVVANRRFYEAVDWALDISEARFTSVEFGSGIPASLIRRDPETQVILRRSTLVGSGWEGRVQDELARIWIDDFLRSGFEDTVLVAGKRGRAFARQLALIQRLQDAGLVEV